MNKKNFILFLFFIFIKQSMIYSSVAQILRINNIMQKINPLKNNNNYTYMRFADKKIVNNVLQSIITLINRIEILININDMNNQDKKKLFIHLKKISKNINKILNNKKFLENNKDLGNFIKDNIVEINDFFLNINEFMRLIILKKEYFFHNLKLIADDLEKLDKSPFKQDLAIIKSHIYRNWKKYLIGGSLIFNYGKAYFKDYQNLMNIEHNYKNIFHCKECSGTGSLIKQSMFFGGNIIRDFTRITFNKDKNKYSTFIAALTGTPIKLLGGYIFSKLQQLSIYSLNQGKALPFYAFIGWPAFILGYNNKDTIKEKIIDYKNKVVNYFNSV